MAKVFCLIIFLILLRSDVHCFSVFKHLVRPTTFGKPSRLAKHVWASDTRLFIRGLSFTDENRVEKALELLDCITTTTDVNSTEYSKEKLQRRHDIMMNNDYSELKLELHRLGLIKNGEKLEMITRLLLHFIDPSIKYNEV